MRQFLLFDDSSATPWGHFELLQQQQLPVLPLLLLLISLLLLLMLLLSMLLMRWVMLQHAKQHLLVRH